MAILERIRCTKCGAEFEEIDENAPFMRCPRIGCGATFVIRQAKEFAKMEIDHTRDIQNLRHLLSEAVEHNELTSMETYAQNIRMWVPDDHFAGFCAALAQKKHGRFSTYTVFLQACHEMTPEERDQVFKIMLSHAYFTMHDEDAVHTFIRLNYPPGQQEEKKLELRKAIDRLTEEQDLLAHIPRDIFICHSSSDADIAMEAYDKLVSDGNTCWISYKNLPQDHPDYWAEIETAIQNCKIILVISSKQCMNRKDPIREMEMASKFGLKRLELKIDDSEHTKFFSHFFDGIQWIKRTESNEKVYDTLRERVCRLLHETEGAGAVNSSPKPDKAGSDQKAAAEGQQKAGSSEAIPAKKDAEWAASAKNAGPNTAGLPLEVNIDKITAAKTKKQKKWITIISIFRRRIGRFLSCILIFAWILLLVINYLGLYNVLDDWQGEMPVLKTIYITGGELYKDYLAPADFIGSTNQVEFLALAGVLLILTVSLPFGSLTAYRAARKLTFWLVLLLSFNIYYYLTESALIRRAILQDKIILMAGYLLHTVIALAVCLLVKMIFHKAAVIQADKFKNLTAANHEKTTHGTRDASAK